MKFNFNNLFDFGIVCCIVSTSSRPGDLSLLSHHSLIALFLSPTVHNFQLTIQSAINDDSFANEVYSMSKSRVSVVIGNDDAISNSDQNDLIVRNLLNNYNIEIDNTDSDINDYYETECNPVNDENTNIVNIDHNYF